MNKRIYFKNFKKVNFIYPKNCLPLWIKNFLYNKNNGGTLSEILTGTSFNLTNTVARKFNIFEIQGNTEQTQYSGKNLMGIDNLEEQTINGIKFTPVYENNLLKYINVNGTATDNSVYLLRSSFFQMNSGSYVLSGCPSGGSWPTYNLTYGDKMDAGNGNAFTLTESFSGQLYIRVGNGTTVNNIKFYPMIRLSSSTAGYEPFCGGTASPSPEFPQTIYNVTGDVNVKIQNEDGTKEQNLPFTLGTQRLYKEDYLADDGIHNVRKQKVFTGEETLYKSGYTTSTAFVCYMILADVKINGNEGKCNIGFVDNVTRINNYLNGFFYNTSGTTVFLKIQNSSIPNWDDTLNDTEKVNLVKALLAQLYTDGTPVILEYELETEETETYTETQAVQYNAIKELYTYKDITNIEGTSSEISPILKIQYYEKEQ